MKYLIYTVLDNIRCRTPHGVRGLKLLGGALPDGKDMSHPARGAWIEIAASAWANSAAPVAPRTGCVD